MSKLSSKFARYIKFWKHILRYCHLCIKGTVSQVLKFIVHISTYYSWILTVMVLEWRCYYGIKCNKLKFKIKITNKKFTVSIIKRNF